MLRESDSQPTWGYRRPVCLLSCEAVRGALVRWRRLGFAVVSHGVHDDTRWWVREVGSIGMQASHALVRISHSSGCSPHGLLCACRCTTFSRGPSLGFQAPRAATRADRPSTGEVAVGPVVAGPTVPGAVSNADGRRLRSSSSWVASTVGARSTNFAVWTSESKAASSKAPVSSLRGPVVLRGLGGARSMSVVVTSARGWKPIEEVEREPSAKKYFCVGSTIRKNPASVCTEEQQHHNTLRRSFARFYCPCQ